jgi:hypothetical protein
LAGLRTGIFNAAPTKVGYLSNDVAPSRAARKWPVFERHQPARGKVDPRHWWSRQTDGVRELTRPLSWIIVNG